MEGLGKRWILNSMSILKHQMTICFQSITTKQRKLHPQKLDKHQAMR